MATKSANVTARVQPKIKRQALTVPNLPTRDSMTDAEFNAMMEKGYHQAKTGEGISVDDAFEKIRKGM